MSKPETVTMTKLKHVLAFPRMMSLICGVSCAEWAEDTATLLYTDGTKESCPCSVVEFHAWGNESMFGIVSNVQDRARGRC